MIFLYIRSKKHPFDVNKPVYYGKRLEELSSKGLLEYSEKENNDFVEPASSEESKNETKSEDASSEEE